MTEAEIYDGVIVNGTADFAFVVETLRRHGASWCAIGGLAVNAYATPVYTADLDLVVVTADLEPVLTDLRAADFRVKEYPFSTNAQRRATQNERTAHRLTVRFATSDRYQPFVEQAALHTILGLDVPVAALADVVQGILWTWNDPTRRASQRSKDAMDLVRLAESHFSEVAPLLPEELRAIAEASLSQTEDDGWGHDWTAEED